MFRGVNNINIDVKGRFGVPSRFREFLVNHCGGEMVVTIDTEEKCLLIYPRPDWDDIQRRVEALPSFNAVTRRVQRLLIGHATDVQLDASGRVLLPPPLRTYANLQKKGILIGQGKKMELWDESAWNNKRDIWVEESQSLGMPQELAGLSL
ncbi:division/cell wall cluster transcriptional repressor MraZ [Gammaproteobacteria bacterium]|nr:division/cell wall cluster transcriptional repressor MraZ [Gammaproteobacteria bacterium]